MYKPKKIEKIENIDKIDKIEMYANSSCKEKLIEKLDALCDAEKRLYFNTQNKLVLDNLMTRL